MAGRLEGKVAFITGAARGQGRAHAIAMAKEGADIIVVDICRQIESNPYPLSTPDDLAETERSVKELGRRVVRADRRRARTARAARRARERARRPRQARHRRRQRGHSADGDGTSARSDGVRRRHRRRSAGRDEHGRRRAAASRRGIVGHRHRLDGGHDHRHHRQPRHGTRRRRLRLEQAGAHRVLRAAVTAGGAKDDRGQHDSSDERQHPSAAERGDLQHVPARPRRRGQEADTRGRRTRVRRSSRPCRSRTSSPRTSRTSGCSWPATRVAT